jgi:hypothetical protein
MNHHFATVNVLVFYVEVLGARTHFVNGGHLDHDQIVLKHTAMHLGQMAWNWEATMLHFLEETHQRCGFVLPIVTGHNAHYLVATR